jgi:hypothetical protein
MLEQALCLGIPDGIATRRHIELGEDCGDVVTDRLHREVELIGDLAVGDTLGKEIQDVELSRGQVPGVGAGGGARTTWDVPGTQLTKLARNADGIRTRVEALERFEGIPEVTFATGGCTRAG